MSWSYYLDFARGLANGAHGGQKYSEQPYIVHLDHVVKVLRWFGFDEPWLLAAGYLHDVLEDTHVTVDDLRFAGFTQETIDVVVGVTDEPGANRKERKAATYPKTAAARPPYGVALKLADRIANIEATGGEGCFFDMYLREHAEFKNALFRAHPLTDKMWSHLERLMMGHVATAYEVES